MLVHLSEILCKLFPASLKGPAEEGSTATGNESATAKIPKKKLSVKWTSEADELARQRHLKQERITPEAVRSLEPNEVFVFGTDVAGLHNWGASRFAANEFGAIPGKPEGPQGRCYAIPTALGDVSDIKPYVDRFVRYAKAHPEKLFLVIPVGCGAAGHEPDEIAPLFIEASDVKNICLPGEFWAALNH